MLLSLIFYAALISISGGTFSKRVIWPNQPICLGIHDVEGTLSSLKSLECYSENLERDGYQTVREEI